MIELEKTPLGAFRYAFIAITGLFLGYKIFDAYQRFSALGVDIVTKYKEVVDTPDYIGIMLFTLLVWSFVGSALGLCKESYIFFYPILAIEGCAYSVLECAFLESSMLGKSTYDIFSFGAIFATDLISDTLAVLGNYYGELFTAIAAGSILGIIILIISAAATAVSVILGVILVVILVVAGISNIGFAAITLVILNFILGIVTFFHPSVPVFLCFAFGIIYFLGVIAIVAKFFLEDFIETFVGEYISSYSTESPLDVIAEYISDTREKISDFMYVDKSELGYLGYAVVAVIIAYVFGLFKNWMDLWQFAFGVENGELILNNLSSQDNNTSMLFVISSIVSLVISFFAGKIPKPDNIVGKLASSIWTFLACVLFSSFGMKIISNWVYTPFTMETGFKIWITNSILPNVSGFLELLANAALLIHYAIYLIIVLLFLFLLIIFSLLSATTVFTHACIMMAFLAMFNINILDINPLLCSLIFMVFGQFVNDYILFSPEFRKLINSIGE